MTRVLDDGKRILIAMGWLLALLGQVLTYVPALPQTQRGLAVATTVIGVASAFVGACLQVVERVQVVQPIDYDDLATALHTRLQAAGGAHAAPGAVNPSPVPPAAAQ